MSDDGTPDLGGIVEEDVSFIDEVENPVLIYPGAYRRVTVELKIHHLAVNALMKSNQINEMEGGVLSGFDTDTTTSHAENATFLPAFRVLKQLMGRCISDAVTSGNVFADAILQHFYRWLCSPMSKLHDPGLHRLLHKYNYGGIQTKSINGSSADSCVLQNESTDDESQVDIVSSWNIEPLRTISF